MQVLILAAGASSRFYPFNTIHKACTTLLGKTIIEHTIESIKKTGITDIIIVVNTDGKIKDILGDGTKLGVTITYVIQDSALGAGDAILRAKEHISGDFFITWANRVEFDTFAKELLAVKKEEKEGVVLVKKTESLEGVGVVKIEHERLVDIIEKPDVKNTPSHLKIVGLYLLPHAFLSVLETTPVDHYSFEKALVAYGKEQIVRTVLTQEETVSLKYPWDILQIKKYLLKTVQSYRGENITIKQGVVLDGPIYIEDGVTIMENAVIKGPCYIGKNAYIGTNATLRNGAVIEENVVVGAYMEIKNSVLFENVTTHTGFIGDSLIGSGSKLAAYFCTANVRLDRKDIEVFIKDQYLNSRRDSLGVIMGSNVKAGIRVSTMPGVVIGHNVLIGPQTTVMKNIADSMKYYTKFQEIIEKEIT